MFATRTAVSRTALRASARRVGGARVPFRFQSSSVQQSSSNVSANIASGLAGGAVVLLGVYGYYHFSGAKAAVDSATSAHAYIKETKDSIIQNAPKNPSEVIQFLRQIAKSYAGVIPGASGFVDSTFDALDHLHDTHRKELDQVLQETYDEISAVLKDVQEKGLQNVDTATAGKLVTILGKRVAQLNELAKKVGGDAFSKFEDAYPQAAQTLGSSYGELKSLAERAGPQARKLVEDLIKQVQDILSNSKGTPDALNRARKLVEEKGQQLKEMVWDTATEGANDNPELKKLLEESKDAFTKDGSSLGSLNEVIERVKQVVKDGADKGQVKELREFLEGHAKEAQSKGWEGLQSWVKSVPGGEEALRGLSDVDVQALIDVSQKKGKQAQDLAQETYQDLVKVLQEKSAKAKKLADEGQREVQDKSGGKSKS